ncbi:hypothetical protein GCM10020331_072770 [Ectobacillus funiculus]
MTMADFVTAVKYDLPIIVIVLNNHKIAMIKFEQEVMGNIEFGTDLFNPNFADYANICGGVGYRVEKPEELLPALQKGRSAKQTVHYRCYSRCTGSADASKKNYICTSSRI